ncbi:MAG: nuclear transport factor 2 family protein [Terriglobia bacterium]
MNRIAAIAAWAFIFALGSSPNIKAQSVLQELTKVQQQWGQGELKKDRRVYDRVCAKDYVQGTRTGEVLTKEQWLRLITKPGGGLTKYHTDNMQVRVLGKGAVALETVQLTLAGRDDKGKPWHTTIRGVRVFEKQNGRWRALLTQFSPPLKSPEPSTLHID